MQSFRSLPIPGSPTTVSYTHLTCGTFRPNNTITRAEVTAIVNKMLGREGDQAFIQQHQEELKRFTDVTSAHWAYYHIAEATNEHDYTKQGNCEKWSSSSYEK